ncbi:hypothetical protein AOLI_G00173480 [Acnodon oligacanthus]
MQRAPHLAIEELKGPSGLDENGVSLFKTPEAIDEMWAAQQRHLECIQDPKDMNMYRVAHTTTINNVDVPYYKCLHGNNSLEGFHKTLPSPLCSMALSGLSDKWHCTLFRETVEENFWAPADVPSNELLGLEYLFGQSMGESFSLQVIVNDGLGPEEVLVHPGQPDPGEAEEAYHSDVEAHGDALDADFLTLRSLVTKRPLFTLWPLKMPAVQTLFLALKSWKWSALCWWRSA